MEFQLKKPRIARKVRITAGLGIERLQQGTAKNETMSDRVNNRVVGESDIQHDR
ncbi:MAG: hypothetical protein MKZ95_16905 [Pirellulales bacterium]|nr:hypothetical protein [Pirellulales bacterium]